MKEIFHQSRKMLALLLVLQAVTTDSMSIGASEQNVTKRDIARETNLGDLYPDWVPFKNKHGDELGEFVDVKSNKKPTKRLALPMNFQMRAVAEPQGEDYYEKEPGESDGDDYFDRKDWSDTNRPAEAVDPDKTNHRNLSEIDGVVNIITSPNHATEVVLKNNRPPYKETSKEEIVDKEASDGDSDREEEEKEKKSIESSKRPKEQEKAKAKEEENDYEETSSEKHKSEPAEEEQSENEAKKASILDSVDQLKERHAEEQRAISEKAKEEEIHKEEIERDKIQLRGFLDKYGNIKSKQQTSDYDEYEDKQIPIQDKYTLVTRPKPTTTTTKPPIRTTRRRKGKKEKYIESGKLSVFKNPRAYMINDDDSIEQQEEPKSTTTKRGPVRFSSKYTELTNNDENERTSLVPADEGANDGEPTLFFPKKRKNRRRRKYKVTPPATDSFVAETVTNSTSKDMMTVANLTSPDKMDKSIAADFAASAVGSGPSPVDSEPSAASAQSASDAVPASSDHKKSRKDQDYHQHKGVDRTHHSEHDEVHEEHGKKAYEGIHEDTKTDKGHHDKEDHLGKYNDHGGFDKHHHDEKEHYGAHLHEEHGKKHAKYEESGKHSKGHSTKGSHDIHKKEEYEKKVEFFEEEGDSAEEEKHGGHSHEREHKSGGHHKKGGLNADHGGHSKGESGHYSKGGHEYGEKGHKGSAGHDSHGKHGGDHFSKGGKASGKKWVYHHGHPAKNANLVPIDRRMEQFYHGPTYFG